MRFFAHAVKQPIIRMELKRERKENEENRKFLSNGQMSKKPVHIGLEIIFIVG